jgi:hypothetical protein
MRDPICQSDRVALPHSYFAAGGAVVGLGPISLPIRGALNLEEKGLKMQGVARLSFRW